MKYLKPDGETGRRRTRVGALSLLLFVAYSHSRKHVFLFIFEARMKSTDINISTSREMCARKTQTHTKPLHPSSWKNKTERNEPKRSCLHLILLKKPLSFALSGERERVIAMWFTYAAIDANALRPLCRHREPQRWFHLLFDNFFFRFRLYRALSFIQIESNRLVIFRLPSSSSSSSVPFNIELRFACARARIYFQTYFSLFVSFDLVSSLPFIPSAVCVRVLGLQWICCIDNRQLNAQCSVLTPRQNEKKKAFAMRKCSARASHSWLRGTQRAPDYVCCTFFRCFNAHN